MVIKEFFPVPILSVVAGSSVAFWSPVVERFHSSSYRGVRRGGGGGFQGVQVNPPFFKLTLFIAWLGMHV